MRDSHNDRDRRRGNHRDGDEKFDLIVMSSDGRGDLARVLRGNQATHVLTSRSVPVLVLPVI
jgi:nucleotide-binding universal stress UspA family protein